MKPYRLKPQSFGDFKPEDPFSGQLRGMESTKLNSFQNIIFNYITITLICQYKYIQNTKKKSFILCAKASPVRIENSIPRRNSIYYNTQRILLTSYHILLQLFLSLYAKKPSIRLRYSLSTLQSVFIAAFNMFFRSFVVETTGPNPSCP